MAERYFPEPAMRNRFRDRRDALMHHQEPNQCEGKCKCEPIGETLDLNWGLSSSANGTADEAHDETSNYRADQQTDSVELRGMYERMRQDENTHEAESEPKNGELQNCEKRIGPA